MSMDPNQPQPYAQQMTPAKSGGSKIWLYLGLGCGLMLVVCCGGVGLMGVYVGKGMMPVTDPAQVVETSRQIADFDVPAGFTPQMAMNVKVPFTGQMIMTMVVYQGADGEGAIFMAQAGQFGDRNQMKQQMEQSIKQQQGAQMKNLRVAESREVEVEIHGQPATFRIQKAEDTQMKQEYIQVEGTFDGKAGAAAMVAQLKADDFSEDDAEKLVRSIK